MWGTPPGAGLSSQPCWSCSHQSPDWLSAASSPPSPPRSPSRSRGRRARQETWLSSPQDDGARKSWLSWTCLGVVTHWGCWWLRIAVSIILSVTLATVSVISSLYNNTLISHSFLHNKHTPGNRQTGWPTNTEHFHNHLNFVNQILAIVFHRIEVGRILLLIC